MSSPVRYSRDSGSPRLNVITDHLDIWAAAETPKKSGGRGRGAKTKKSPHGIKKLRELILELAVSGKLVPQDPNDEPASELLSLINRARKTFPKPSNKHALEPISDDEIGFTIPRTWEKARLGSLVNIVYGKGLATSKLLPEGFPVFGANGVIGFYSSYIYEKPQLLVSCRGAYSGKPNISPPSCFVTSNSLVLESYGSELDKKFLYFQLESIDKSKIITGSAQPQVTTTNAVHLPICIPPLEEQHRIVAKVDELMALCDVLEQEQTESSQAHQTLVETLLTTLTQAQQSGQLTATDGGDAEHAAAQSGAAAWFRIAEHFDTLFTTEQSIDQLKQTILQLAVMGKLVPQDPNDEPASELLKKIAAEKARLIKEKKIKKQKPMTEISEDEKRFQQPIGWVYSRLGAFTIVGTGSTPTRGNADYYFPAEINWVTSGETSNDLITETKEKISPLAVKETNVSVYPIGSLVVAMYGQGKTRGQVSELLIEAGTNQACAAIQFVNKEVEHRKYIKLFFQKSYDELRSHAAGGAQPNLNLGKVSQTIIPIPPLAEQHRIVAKVDELMALCDSLKERLKESQTTQVQLADAIVEQAVV